MQKNKTPTVSAFRFLIYSTQTLKNPLSFHNKYFTKSTIQTKDLAKYVVHGLLISEGELWQKQRKLIQPAFHKKQLLNLFENIYSTIKLELGKIELGKTKNIFTVFNNLSFQTVAKSLFSSTMDQTEINKLQYTTEFAQKILVKELRQPYLGWWFRLNEEIRKRISETKEARDILKNPVKQRKNSGKLKDDLLEILPDAHNEDENPMDENKFIGEILILFTAGHETISNTLTFTCELLAQNPEIQERIFLEIGIAKKETKTLMDFIKAHSFTKNVIEEPLRLHLLAYFIECLNIEDDEFKGMRIPKNSRLLLSLLEIHTHLGYWAETLKYNPNRFVEGTSNQYSLHYFPLVTGSLMCIDNNFTMYEMIIAIAEIITTYKTSKRKPQYQIKPLIALKPNNVFS